MDSINHVVLGSKKTYRKLRACGERVVNAILFVLEIAYRACVLWSLIFLRTLS